MRKFTLVEISITIAVLMCLMAIAVFQVYHTQSRARRAEMALIADGLLRAEIAYHGSHDMYYWSPTVGPDATPSRAMRQWDLAATGHDALTFRPDGAVRGSYMTSNYLPACAGSGWTAVGALTMTNGVIVAGLMDVDSDGEASCGVASSMGDDVRGFEYLTAPDVY